MSQNIVNCDQEMVTNKQTILSLKAFSLNGFGHHDAMFTTGWQSFQI